MEFLFKSQKFTSKSSIMLISIACYWIYLSICVGYFLSKIFFNFLDQINKTNLSKNIKFRKKYNLEKILKFIIHSILKFFKAWFQRVGKKMLLVIESIYKLIKALKILKKKFKSILRFKYNFRLLKILLQIFWEIFQVFISLINEVLFLHNVRKFLIEWKQFLLLLMAESILITGVIYILYTILLALFGILLGFLLATCRQNEDVCEFILLLLLKMLHNNGFDYDLLKPNKVDLFFDFSFKPIGQVDPRTLRLIFKEPDQIPFPFSIIEDPIGYIETEILYNEPINYVFELFTFYQNVNKKDGIL